MSTFDKYFDCNGYFIKNIDIFIDAFVSYYGEDKRKDIEERFRNNLFFLYLKPSSLGDVINYIREECAYSICRELVDYDGNIKQSGLTFNYKEFVDCDRSNFYMFHCFYRDEVLPTIDNINRLIDTDYQVIRKKFPYLDRDSFIEGIMTNSIPDAVINRGFNDCTNFNELLNRTYSNLTSINSIMNILCIINGRLFDGNYYTFLNDQALRDTYKFTSRLDKLYSSYNRNCEELDRYSDYASRYERYSSRLYYRVFNEFLFSNQHIIDDMLDKAIELGLCESYNLDTISIINDFIFGSSFFIPSKLLVRDGDQLHSDYEKDNRIKLLRLLGVTDSCEDILSNPLYLSLIPSYDVIERLEADKFSKYKEVSRKLLINFLDNKKIYDSFRSMNFTRDYIDSIFNTNACGFMCNGLSRNTNIFHSIIVLNMGHYLNHLSDDHFLVHELNHLYEGFNSTYNDGNDYIYGSGWDLTSSCYSDSDNPYGENRGPYTEINEVINEIISKEISSKMHEEGRYLFSNPLSKLEDCSGYDCMIPMVQGFYNTYREDIINSRKSGRIDIIFDSVGRDNFDELSSLCREFYINSIKKDNGEINSEEYCDSYVDFEGRRDTILDKMREFNSKKNKTI